ncbi:hypothetical protein SAMN05444369_101293 [Capnocytophaga haemolytica]|uniref:Uncharacterized protein n=1 Tax=Capnocytophaga haemolytica TaxID=45243 RepID=A0AAX2GVJ2_9FLAO|nr:DUF6722 family protein [Capnocytophaga haemolytica]AMD85114.1 hypothetical protein AXF12_06025 [Capnocytophaga haemolytica]SFN67783.1 hypothetical protein SAMN05444369_101293 [Capnocytophaga haemolytica]SNV04914.1 Uncharacterised protein [Capnocytophaga haemolytica]
MKKEFGKWLLDIAKYIVTAVFISNTLVSTENSIYAYIGGVLAVFITMAVGLFLLKEPQAKKRPSEE